MNECAFSGRRVRLPEFGRDTGWATVGVVSECTGLTSHKQRVDIVVLNGLGPLPRDYNLTGVECSIWGFYTFPR